MSTSAPGQSGTDRSPAGLADRIVEWFAYIPSGDTIPDDEWRRRHRKIVVSTLIHVPFLTLFGLYHGTESITGATFPVTPLWVIAAGQGFTVLVTGLAYPAWFPRRVRTALATTGLVATSVALVQYSGGFIEAHFHFFVILGVLALYEDWIPFALGIVYVGLSHGVFGTIDASLVYNHAPVIQNPWVWGVIHAIFVSGLALALMSNWVSTEKSRETAQQRLERVEQKEAELADLEEKRAEVEAERRAAEQAREKAEAERQAAEQARAELESVADEYSEVMARAAGGDLTARLDADTDNDAMGRIADSFNDMMDELEAAVGEIQRFSDEVAAEGQMLNDEGEEVRVASAEINDAVEGIDGSATRQQEMLADLTEEMTQISAAVEEVAASAETVADRSEETAEVADRGEATARQAIENAEQVQAAVETTAENVETLDDRMDEIDEIVGLISDIAEQNNMLALNANIEAARAGGEGAGADGDGFAVVADEVKQLAEETRGSAAEIEELIVETQSQADRTVEEVRTAEAHVAEAVEAVEDVVAAFGEVAENTDETDRGIQEISATADDQAGATENAVAMIDEVEEFSRQTADETAQVLAATEQQTASMSQVTASIGTLTERAEELRSLVDDFTVAADTGASSRPGAGTRDRTALGDGGPTS